MNRFEKLSKPAGSAALLLAVLLAGCGGGGGNDSHGRVTATGAGTGVAGAGNGPAPIEFGAAANFVILAETQITNVPTSVVTGNAGLSGTGADNGLACTDMAGTSTIYAIDNTGSAPTCTTVDVPGVGAAILAKGIAYTDGTGRAPDYKELWAGNIGGRNFGPATYKWSSAVSIPTNITLTGGANDVWIFQIAQGLTVGNGVQVILAGGAQAKNVYWLTGETAALGTTVQFKGAILSQKDITLTALAKVDGSLFASTAVTLIQNTITKP